MTEIEALRARLEATEARVAMLERLVRALVNNDTAQRLRILEVRR